MAIPPLHRWDLSPDEARSLQRELADRVDTGSPLGPCRLIAAADVSYTRGDDRLFAAVVVIDAETSELVERVGLVERARYPYVPGLLSFREAPPVLEAFGRLKHRPDVLLCDGQGIAHPRRLGIASHVGLWLDLPTVGCAKSLLCGSYDEPGPGRGDRSPLIHRGEVVGTVLRTRDRISPVFVSPGHRCDAEGAVRIVMETTGNYRLCTPVRMAHAFVNELRRGAGE
ncbi:endonuclease V [Tautonia sociabilis]|uniref:Endonuclease V n=1 Tax=Tautonia sociabilis TaxID=2080755 RepID=A0A432MHI4_9BACT|nr:endonuclease V [Tautonia sociabilis]RUL86760.1 endonuclease V [Tautonia sociabilis]